MSKVTRPRGNNKEEKARTIRLVKKSIKELRRTKADITLKSLEQVSKNIDTDGNGICHTAILKNSEANRLYSEARKCGRSRARRRSHNVDLEIERPTFAKDRAAKERRMMKNCRKIEIVDRYFHLLERYEQLRLAHDEVSAKLIDEQSR